MVEERKDEKEGNVAMNSGHIVKELFTTHKGVQTIKTHTEKANFAASQTAQFMYSTNCPLHT